MLKVDVEYLTVEAVARRWSCSPWSVSAWARAGRIPGAARMGRSWRIPVSTTLLPKPVASPATVEGALAEIDQLTSNLRVATKRG